MNRFTPFRRTLLCLALSLLLVPGWSAQAQSVSTGDVVPLTLEQAIEIALVNNYTVRNSRLDVRNAAAQVREAWGQVMPQVDASSSYTRNVVTANPFAGSEAGNIFSGLGAIGWLEYNEQARLDDDPTTEPIRFADFLERRQAGLEVAGGSVGGSDNPFGVANQFQNGITVEQTLFNGSAFAAIAGAERLKDVNRLGLQRQEQLMVQQVREVYYQALLAQRSAEVSRQSVARTQQTLQEVSRKVEQGVQPKFQRLSAEVELANLETAFVQTQNQAELALDNLKYQLGLPIEQPIELRGQLSVDDPGRFLTVSTDDAMAVALQNRPDLAQARTAIELREINKNITRAEYLPRFSAFANFNYTGQVPDNRTSFFEDRETPDPFDFERQSRGFFSDAYWNPSVSVGLRMTWNIFNGFQTSARVQQRQVEVARAELQLEQQMESVRLEVERARRNLEAARRRIQAQQQNVQRAELNYDYAERRLAEGVTDQLQLREASEQLDQSRFNFLQAVHDYLVAQGAFETAMGVPLATDPSDLRSTERTELLRQINQEGGSGTDN